MTKEEKQERAKKRAKEWYAKNKAYAKERERLRYLKNPEPKRAQARAWRLANPERKKENGRVWRIKNREKLRLYMRKWSGLPEPTRERPTLCECCNGPPNKQGLHLDHCHASGEFRGWLCARCNTSIGGLGDSIEGLQQAIEYLRRSNKKAATR